VFVDSIRPHILALCRIMQSTVIETIDAELAGIVAQSGFGGYCFAVLPDGPVISGVLVTLRGGNLGPLVDVYVTDGLVRDDPVLRAAARLVKPVRWSEYLAPNGENGGQRLRTMLDEAEISDGVTIPAAAVNGRCRALLSVSASTRKDRQAFEETFSHASPLLQLAALALGCSPVANRTGAAELSNSEALVLAALAEGMRPREIALKLGKSEHTIRNQIVSAQQRLGARTKEQALVMAIRLGLVRI
jgi:DNA-binding CsgD family transcriptional regulator